MNDSPLQRGIRAPDFALPFPAGEPVRFYSRAGGLPCVLIFADRLHAPLVEDFARKLAASNNCRIEIFGIFSASSINRQVDAELSFDTFIEPNDVVSDPYGVSGTKPSLFTLDGNLRVVSWHPLENPQVAASHVFHDLRDISDGPKAQCTALAAPVLFVPRVLDKDHCSQLTAMWHRKNVSPTGVEKSLAGQRVDVVDTDQKRRRDWVIEDSDLLSELTSCVGRRILPEVQKAFAFRTTRFEGFKIVRYGSDEGGFFHAHRDNLSPATAHRKFGLTLNLNTDFEGGELKFPEYGPHLYRPGAGEALLFSSSLLHEVLPVTHGERFSLLSFLFDLPRQ